MANEQQKSPEERKPGEENPEELKPEKRSVIQGLETFINPLEKTDPELYHYLIDTVADQMDYYRKGSRTNQKLYKHWTRANIVVSALIPVAAAFSSAPWPFKLLMVALGTASTAISAVLAKFHYKDLWVSYRNTRELLLRILRCYFMNAGPFRNYEGDKKAKLVEMCEEAMSSENSEWASAMRKASDSDEKKRTS